MLANIHSIEPPPPPPSDNVSLKYEVYNIAEIKSSNYLEKSQAIKRDNLSNLFAWKIPPLALNGGGGAVGGNCYQHRYSRRSLFIER